MGEWTHPSHKKWFYFGGYCHVIQFAVVMFIIDFSGLPLFRHLDGETTIPYEPFYMEQTVKCSVNFCYNDPENEDLKISDNETESSAVFDGMTIIECQNGNVLTNLIKVCQGMTIANIFIRFDGCFMIVHHMRTVNYNFMRSGKDNIVQIETGMLSIYFASIIPQILVMMAFTICVDWGSEGESHIDRLAREARGDNQSQASGGAPIERKNSSYKPETMDEERKSVIASVRKSIVGGDGAAALPDKPADQQTVHSEV